jgi:hypothetical protein
VNLPRPSSPRSSPAQSAASGLLAIFFSSVALAQTAAAPLLKEKEPPPLREIERGFYFRGAGGPYFITKAPTTSGRPSPFSAGQMAQVELGMDFGEHFSLGIFGMGTANRAGADYIGKSLGEASGDFAALIPGAAARISFVGIPDNNGVKRTWIYVRGGAGYVKFFPKVLLPAEMMVFVGPGIEYFTRLRHFSVGFELSGSYLLTSKTFGFALAPNLRYAF